MEKTIIVKTIDTPLVTTIFTWTGGAFFYYHPNYAFNKEKPTKRAWHRGSWQLSITTNYKELNDATKTIVEHGIAQLSDYSSKPFKTTNSILFDFSELEVASGRGRKTADGTYEIICTEDLIIKILLARLDVNSTIGGTAMHCPSCEKIRTCESVNYEEFSKGKFRRFYSPEVDKVNWFARARKCRTCFYIFETAEVSKKVLSEFLNIKKKISISKDAVEELSKTGKVVKLQKSKKKIIFKNQQTGKIITFTKNE